MTVVAITYRRIFLLDKAFKSFLAAKNKAGFSIQFHLLVNGQDDETREWIESHRHLFESTNSKYVMLPKAVSPAAARNLLLAEISSDWVFFMDDDVNIPPDFFSSFEGLSTEFPQVDVWGGPNLTPVSHKKFCAGWFAENPLITGPLARRYCLSGKKIQQGGQFNLMLCNLIVKARCLKDRGFLEFLKTAEENEWFYYIVSQGWRLAASDRLYVWHERRGSGGQLLKQIFYYGFGRGQLLVHDSLWRQKIFLLPPLLTVAILAGLSLHFGYAAGILSIWLSVIQFSYVRRFGRWDVSALILPPLIWLSYVGGMLRGASGLIFFKSFMVLNQICGLRLSRHRVYQRH